MLNSYVRTKRPDQRVHDDLSSVHTDKAFSKVIILIKENFNF